MKISGFCPFLTIHPLDIHVLIIAKMQYVTHHLVPFGFFFFISYFIVLLIYTPEKIICYTDCYVTFLLLHNMKCTVTLLPVELLIDSLAQIPTICLLVFVWTHRKKVRILTFFFRILKKKRPPLFYSSSPNRLLYRAENTKQSWKPARRHFKATNYNSTL